MQYCSLPAEGTVFSEFIKITYKPQAIAYTRASDNRPERDKRA